MQCIRYHKREQQKENYKKKILENGKKKLENFKQ